MTELVHAGAPGQAVPVGPPVPLAAAQAIDARLPQLVRDERPLDDFSIEGTRVTAWRQGRQILRIEVVALGESGRTLLDFWWTDAGLLAARERRITYGDLITRIPLDQPLPMKLSQDETLHFRAGAVAGYSVDGADTPRGTALARQRGAELGAMARSFARLMRTQPALATANCRWVCVGAWQAECAGFACR